MKKILILLLLLVPLNVYTAEKFYFKNAKLDNYSNYSAQLINFSRTYKVDISILELWIFLESSGNERAYNRYSKDKGLVQLHDVEYLVSKYWDKSEDFNVWNGEHNLYIGLKYLGDLIEEFGTYFGFMAYNIGPTRVRAGRILKVGINYSNRLFEDSLDKG